MKKATLFLYVLLCLALSLPTLAQSDQLTESYTSQTGDLTVRYPDSWIVALDDVVILANGPSALAAVLGVTTMAENDVAFSFIAPAELYALGIPTNADAASTLDAFIAASSLSGTGKAYAGLGVPASSAFVSGEGVENAELVALEFDGGSVVVAIEFGGPPAAKAGTVAAILSGLSFDGQTAAGEAVVGAPIRQWASRASGSTEYGSTSWNFGQATGAPNTVECADRRTAWASSSSTGTDTLALEFDTAVIASEVHIYQSFNPGSITGVMVGLAGSDQFVEVPNSADPPGNTACPGVFTLDLSAVDQPIDSVVINLDQTIGGGWNEIDAVELVGVPAGDSGAS